MKAWEILFFFNYNNSILKYILKYIQFMLYPNLSISLKTHKFAQISQILRRVEWGASIN